ncbi:MAG: chromosome segregation protein SMC, partial [Balneolaceae bacterium]
TMKDLQRLEDILVEIRKNVKSLEKQAEKAEKAKTFREELEQLDMAFNLYEYKNVQQELEPLKERIENAEKEKRELTKALEEREEAEEKAQKELIDKERGQAEAQRYVNQIDSSIRDMETSLKITREKISNSKEVIEQHEKDIRQGNQDLKDLEELKGQSTAKLESLGNELEQAELSLNESKKKFALVQQEYSQLRHDVFEIEVEISDKNRELNEIRGKQIKLESKLENTEDDLIRINRDVNDLENEIENAGGQMKLIRTELEKLNKKRENKMEVIAQAAARREELDAERETIREAIRSVKSRIDSVRSEIELLSELSQSREMFPSSVAWLIEHHAGSFDHMVTVGDVLNIDEDHASALEAALGDAMNFVIVPDMKDALRASGLLKEHKKGRATFIPLQNLHDSYPAADDSIAHKINCDSKFRPLARLLLGSVQLADTIEKAWEMAQNGASSVVTIRGDLITSSQFLKSGSSNKQSGVRLGLRDKLDKLGKKENQLIKELDGHQKKLEQAEEQLSKLNLEQLRSSLRETESEIRRHEQQASSFQSGIQVYEKNIRELQNRKQSLISNEGSAREELETLRPGQKELQSLIASLHEEKKKKQDQLKKLEDDRAIAQNRYNDAQLKHQDVKNIAGNIERDIERAKNGINNLQKRLVSRKELMELSKTQIESFSESIKLTEQQLAAKREEKQEADLKLQQAEEATAVVRGRINEIDKELKVLRQKKEVNLELVHHLVMAKEKFELQSQAHADHIWETYGLLMNQIDADMPEETDPETAKKRIGYLRQKLNQFGEVNPLAINEFKEEKERLDFYETQIDDLQQAEKELRQTINEINATANRRFNETFEAIRTNFKTVFSTLFHEDDFCDLLIEQDVEDPLEAKIEIKANPRGKRPSGINQLSGGEKTLTAIALLFAIYLVKPSPFCVLDEVDAPLDDANIERFSKMIKKFSKETQFIIITHNKKTMSKAEMMYGVTMPETGVSRLVGVRLDEVSLN